MSLPAMRTSLFDTIQHRAMPRMSKHNVDSQR